VRAKISPDGRTFADEARRAQLVDCAIDVIAEEGFARASLARIAQRAGVAKSVVLYHFANKDELVEQVLAAVSLASVRTLADRVGDAPTHWDRVRGSIEAVVGFVGTHRAHALAGLETWNQTRSLPGRSRLVGPGWLATTAAIEQTLADGQRAGEFGEFDPRVMAVMVVQAIDAAVLEAALNPAADLAAFTAELVEMFDRALHGR
jgi:AcrR family transcriptional regulator